MEKADMICSVCGSAGYLKIVNGHVVGGWCPVCGWRDANIPPMVDENCCERGGGDEPRK